MLDLDKHPILRGILIVGLNIGFIAGVPLWKRWNDSSDAASSSGSGSSRFPRRETGRVLKPSVRGPAPPNARVSTTARPNDLKTARQQSAIAAGPTAPPKSPRKTSEHSSDHSTPAPDALNRIESLAHAADPEWLIPGAAEFMLGQTYSSRQRPQNRFQLVLSSCRGRVSEAADGSWQITDIRSEWRLEPKTGSLTVAEHLSATIDSMPALSMIPLNSLDEEPTEDQPSKLLPATSHAALQTVLLEAARQMGTAATTSATTLRNARNSTAEALSQQRLAAWQISLQVPSVSRVTRTARGLEWTADTAKAAGDL